MSRDFGDPYLWILADNNEVYRLNTVTQQLDDYTAKFSQYAGYKLFDIAGFQENTVALAGRAGTTTKIIAYDEGVYSYPDEEINLPPIEGNVVAIGPCSIATDIVFETHSAKMLLIATDQAFYRFNIENLAYYKHGDDPSQIYAANYRTQFFNVLHRDGIKGPGFLSVFGTTPLYVVGVPGVINNVPPFPAVVNTAYFTTNQVVTTREYTISDVFWGTNTGMYHRKLWNNNPYDNNYRQYLNNVKINKIADVFGFMALGNNVAKENLLIGTDQGLYYSTSVLHPGYDDELDNFTLYHYDKLGNIKINYIEVNARSTYNPTCENGIYLATDDGIYLVRPDYVPHTDVTKPISAIHFAFDTEDITEKTVCAGEPVKITLNEDITANAIQWFKDGKEILNENGSTISVTQSGEYAAVLFDPCGGIHVESKPLHLTVIPAPVVTFNYPDKIQVCDNTPVVLTTENNPDYQYRWVINDNLNSETTNTLTATYSARYRVEVSNCTNSWVPSKEVRVEFINLPIPMVTALKTTYCEGEQAPLSVSVPIDPSYTIKWYKDGVLLPGDDDLTTIYASANGSYVAVLKSTVSDCTQPSQPVQINFIAHPVFTFDYPDKLQFCDVASTVLKTDNNAAYNYRWYKDGVLNGQTTPSLTVTASGKYKVEVSACTNTWFSSKEIQVDLIHLPLPAVSPNKNLYCEGEVAVLSVNTALNSTYIITWYKDGVLMPANDNLASIKITAAGNYSVVLNSTIADCTKSSAPLAVTFTPAPVFTFSYPNEISYCFGSPLTLKADGSTAYQYRWYKNGVLTGDIGPSLAVTNSGIYKIEVSSCAGSWVTSKDVSVNFIQLPLPVVSTDKPGYCIGDNARLSTSVPVSALYTINWYHNGQLMAGNSNQTSLFTNVPGDYSLTVINNKPNTDGSFCSENSITKTVLFEPPPIATIEKIVRTTLCDGQQVDLLAHYSSGTIKWATGETTDRISIRSSGIYKFTVTTTAGCEVEASTALDLLPLPVFNVQDTSICAYKHQTVTLQAPQGFTGYAWNGISGSATYEVTQPQTVTLTVTDANGCQATKQIIVADQCPEVIIPNTFTPNNDGINDTWAIGGLEGDRTATVIIYNRSGSEVYKSRGYGTAWNGQYRGAKLPAGVYYYIITAKHNSKKFSGYVTVLY